MFLTLEERDRRWKRIREAMENQEIECLIVWGCFGRYRHYSANLIYLSGLMTEGFLIFPLEGDPTLIVFAALPNNDRTSWIADTRSGHPKCSKVISEKV